MITVAFQLEDPNRKRKAHSGVLDRQCVVDIMRTVIDVDIVRHIKTMGFVDIVKLSEKSPVASINAFQVTFLQSLYEGISRKQAYV